MARTAFVTSVLRKLKSHVQSKQLSSSTSILGSPVFGHHLANEKPLMPSALSHLNNIYGDRASERPRPRPGPGSEGHEQITLRRLEFQKHVWPTTGSTPKFREKLWSHRSLQGTGTCVLHPTVLIHHCGLASASGRDNSSPSSDSSESVENSVKELANNTYDGVLHAVKATRDALDTVLPPIKDALEAHPLAVEVSIPVIIFIGAWAVLPRVLRRVHAYTNDLPATAFLEEADEEFKRHHLVPYELSVWKAMEEPARLFATLLTVLQMGTLISSSSAVATEYLTRLWSGGSLLCVAWFLHRWKGRAFRRVLSYPKITKADKESYMTMDKVASFGLIFLGGLGVAQGLGVAPSSLLTVGGVGGLAAAFAAREILANMLTGLTLSFSKPFSVGDTIRAGGIEGNVQEVGIFATRLLTPEKSEITVPNAFFTNQAITNKSRVPWRPLAMKIPLKVGNFESVPRITLEIREMLYRNPEVFLDEDKPECHVSHISAESLEVAISCNIKPMSKAAYLVVEQGILVDAARIMTSCGATVAGVT